MSQRLNSGVLEENSSVCHSLRWVGGHQREIISTGGNTDSKGGMVINTKGCCNLDTIITPPMEEIWKPLRDQHPSGGVISNQGDMQPSFGGIIIVLSGYQHPSRITIPPVESVFPPVEIISRWWPTVNRRDKCYYFFQNSNIVCFLSLIFFKEEIR